MNAPLAEAARPALAKRVRLPGLSRQDWEEGLFAAICLLAFVLLMVLAQSMNSHALEPVASLSGDTVTRWCEVLSPARVASATSFRFP